MTQNEKAVQAIKIARTALILDHPWYGGLVMRLPLKPESDAPCPVPTMATDGTNLFYNADWTLSLSKPELIGVLAHEVIDRKSVV